MNQIRAAVIVALAVSGVTCNDLRVGSSNGRIVFNETIQASPAIWRQSQQITVNVSDHEYISCVMVTDNREEKDGEAKIVGGGEGYNNVTIELKSPAIFRGFDFHVVVYATEGNGQHIEGQQTVIDTQHPVINGQHPVVDSQHPIVLTKDTDLNGKAKPETNNSAGNTKVTEKPLNGDKTPQATVEVPRINRHTLNQDPIVNFVKGKELNGNESADVTTEKVSTTQHTGLKVNNPVSVTPIVNEKKGDESNLKVNGPTTFHTTTTTTTTTVAPKDEDIKSTTEKFDSVSKELGQKVVYGIKNH